MTTELLLARPWVLWALVLLPALGLLRRRWQRSAEIPLSGLQLAGSAGGDWRRGLAWGEVALEVLVVGLVLVALAGPYRQAELELIEEEGIDVMLVLDVSLSMMAEDFPPNRLEALRGLARDFVGRAGGHRVGLVVFAKDSYVQTPLTRDHRSLFELLDGVTVYAMSRSKSGGTAVGDALLVATDRLRANRVEGRDQAMVLITDGESNEGIDPVLAARYVREQEVRLYAVGVGGTEPVGVIFEGNPVGGDETPYQAYLDDTQLKQLTQAAEGRYWRATDAEALASVFAELSRLESAPLSVRTVYRREPLGSWVTGLAFGLFVLWLAVATNRRRPYA